MHVSTSLHGPPRSARRSIPQASLTSDDIAARRKDITDRLGLAETASNAEVFAAVDKVVKPRPNSARAIASNPQAAEDALFNRVMGRTAVTAPAKPKSDDALFKAVYG